MDRYLEALKGIPRHLKDPTLEQVQALCPHLPPGVVADHFATVAGGGDGWYFMTPGVRVLGAVYHISVTCHDGHVVLSRSGTSNIMVQNGRTLSMGHQEALAWQTIHGPAEALLNPTVPGADSTFALPRWARFTDCYVQDPGKHRRTRYEKGHPVGAEPCEYDPRGIGHRPTTVAAVALVQHTHPNTFNNSEEGRAMVGWQREDHYTDLIIHGSDVLLWEEVQGASVAQGGGHYWCSRCGTAMGLTGCDQCHLYFPDDAFRTGGGPCISPRVQEIVEQHGHTFDHDPQTARDRESKAHTEMMERQYR